MSTSTLAITPSASARFSSAFWERLWRTSGLQFVVFFVITYVIYGYQPGVGAPTEALTAFYGGNRVRVLIAAVFSGLNVLNLMWFAAALRAALADAEQDGWGAAAIASSAAFGGLWFLLASLSAALAYSIAGSRNYVILSTLNDFSWVLAVLTSFPRAMLIMASAFGLWRAGLISNELFTAGVVAVVLGLLGGTTWLSGGFWAPDGAYSRVVSPLIGLAWIAIVSRILLIRSPAKRPAW